MSRRTIVALGGSLLMGVAGVASAETSPSQADLQAQVSQLQKQVAELQNGQNNTWLNERRAEEVKALVREVLADADTRASLLETGLTAGHNKQNFFLASDDGNFLMNVSGQVQVRYIANFREDAESGVAGVNEDDEVTGFQIRRAKVQFEGHIGSPSILYKVRLAADRDGGTVYAEEATVGYKLTDTLTVRAGRSKAPFLKEELISSGKQLAVERSLVNEIFTAGYVEGVYATLDATDAIRLQAALHDGVGSGEFGAAQDFNASDTDYALAGRVDVRLMGNWAQAEDFSAWEGEPTGLFVGAGVNYDVAETGNAADNDKDLRWTVDAQFESAGFSAFAAFNGRHFDNDADAVAEDNFDIYGLVAQAGYMVIPNKLEPFARFEWINLDSGLVTAGYDQNLYLVTVGANYYLKKHSAKLTLDAVWALEGIPPVAIGDVTGLGLLADSPDDENQVVIRGQFQVLF